MSHPSSTRPPVALVTGATSGIGAAAAAALLEKGFTVYGTGRDPRRVTVPGVRSLTLDVTDDESMVQATRTVLAEHGTAL